MYGTIEEWLKSKSWEALQTYDFREEIVTFQTGEPLERHIHYKAIWIAEHDKKDENEGEDASKRIAYQEAKEIYERYEKDHKILKHCGEADKCDLLKAIFKRLSGVSLDGDTMNSIQTTLNEAMRFTGRSMVEQFETDPGKLKGKLKALTFYPDARCFLQTAYTIGNFIPVPQGCNRPQASITKDYWDLTLLYIYKWYRNYERYDSEERDIIEKIFRGDRWRDTHVKTYSGWLKTFKTWDNFVEQNFLQDYTEWQERPYGRPKEFWDGHFDGAVLPVTEDQFKAFFSRAADCIKSRSERMVCKLWKKMEGGCA